MNNTEKEPWREAVQKVWAEGGGLIELEELVESLLDAQRAELVKAVEGMQEYNMFPGSDRVFIRKEDILQALDNLK